MLRQWGTVQQRREGKTHIQLLNCDWVVMCASGRLFFSHSLDIALLVAEAYD